MALDTYANLLTALGDKSLRTDQAANWPDFVAMAEADINSRLRSWRATDTTTGTISGATLALPSGFLGVRQFRLTAGQYTKLEYVSVDRMDELKGRADVSGEPTTYTMRGDVFELYPEPSSSVTYRLTFYKALPALVSNSTNWLLTAYPGAYLYGALRHYGIMSEDSRLQFWDGEFEKIRNIVNAEPSEGDRLTVSLNAPVI